MVYEEEENPRNSKQKKTEKGSEKTMGGLYLLLE
jgi:hypothetical protein